MDTARPYNADVVIVGAGLAGLTAARSLNKAGYSTTVLEGRSEVGGRTRSRLLGGEFIGRPHVRMRRLARELGVTLQRSGFGGAPTRWQVGNEVYTRRLPKLSLKETQQIVAVMWRLSRLAKGLGAHTPWVSRVAAAHDHWSVAGWLLEQSLKGRGLAILTALIEGFALTPIDRLSLLHLLWWIRRAGGWLRALRSGSEYRVRDGAQTLARRVAGQRTQPVITEAPVERIVEDGNGVSVYAWDGRCWVGRAAIVCVPLPTLDQIAFKPSLPEPMRALSHGISLGSGLSFVAAGRQTVSSKHRIAIGDVPFPLAWQRGVRTAKGLMIADEGHPRDSAFVALADIFGLKDAAVDRVDWGAEPFARGSYIAPEPGQLTRYGVCLQRSHGRVHFAGAERSSWPNSMEGAIESGQQAASRILSG